MVNQKITKEQFDQIERALELHNEASANLSSAQHFVDLLKRLNDLETLRKFNEEFDTFLRGFKATYKSTL